MKASVGALERVEWERESVGLSTSGRTGRRKRKVYVSPLRQQSSPGFQFGRKKRLRSVSRRIPLSNISYTATVMRNTVNNSSDSRVIKRIHSLRKQLQWLSCLLVLINGVESVLGYFLRVVGGSEVGNAVVLSTGLMVLSVLEMVLIGLYWQQGWRYEDLRYGVVRADHVHISSIWHAPGYFYPCVIEMAAHVLAPYPSFSLSVSISQGGVESQYTLEDMLFIAVVLRNYHFLRVLYWFSPFSHLRTFMYTRITNVTMGSRFIFRCYLQKYGLALVVGIYGLVCVMAGPVQYVLEKTSSAQVDTSLWTSWFTVAYTQTCIGYGVATPTTLFAQVAIILSIFSGIMLHSLANSYILEKSLLSITQFRMCAALQTNTYKRKHMSVIVHVIQSWWRLIMSRLKKRPNPVVVSLFYRNLAKFRRILVHCYRIHTGFFPNQIASFEDKVGTRIRRSSEYLYAVKHISHAVTHTQTLDLARNQYFIKEMTKRIRNNVKKQLAQYSPQLTTSPSLNSPVSFVSRLNLSSPANKTRQFARAQQTAMQNVKQRLIRQKMPSYFEDFEVK